MSSFTKPLIVKHLDGRKWELVESFVYFVGHEDSSDRIHVPEGFITDFASIPRIFWTIIGPPTGEYGKAAIIHDYLYSIQTNKRSYADRIFLEAMKVLKVNWLKRRLMWFAVRSFGWRPWNKHAKRLNKNR